MGSGLVLCPSDDRALTGVAKLQIDLFGDHRDGLETVQWRTIGVLGEEVVLVNEFIAVKEIAQIPERIGDSAPEHLDHRLLMALRSK